MVNLQNKESTYILGISAFYHDSSACLVKNGVVVAAAQEERFTRIKHDSSFPKNAISFCLDFEDIQASHLDIIAFYEKPLLKFERILETYISYAPLGIKSFLKAMPLWVKKKIWIREILKDSLKYSGKIIFCEHHESHAASAFFPSPFQESAFITMDGVGEWTTTSYGTGRANEIKIIAEISFPHSIGLLYSAFTYYTGFKVNSGEYKVMGLAPYGEPRYKDMILKHIIDVKEDGSFRMNIEYFNYCAGLTMTNSKFHDLFGGPPRKPESVLTQRHMDIARSIQDVIEEIVVKIARYVNKQTGMKNLCLSGGVALNCVANGKLLREKIFDKIWVQPAAGDAGAAIGCALIGWHHYLGKSRQTNVSNDLMNGAFLGPEYDNDHILKFIDSNNIPYKKLSDEMLSDKVADLIAEGKVIGWFQGRMEFGPRALGARSILGDARSIEMQKIMNLKIKYRESFRPFAPSVRSENTTEWFDIDQDSPYMMFVANIQSYRQNEINEEKSMFGLDKLKLLRSEIPAVTHVDYSARIHSVSECSNPLYHSVLTKFYKKFNCPVIVNTSFNVRGEPIVCTPKDAWLCFMRTEMDFLVIGSYIIDKIEQRPLTGDADCFVKYKLD